MTSIFKKMKKSMNKSSIDFDITEDKDGETINFNYDVFMPPEDEECPEFQEIFIMGDGVIIGIEKIIRCPDETALIRVLTEKQFSKQFRKRVYLDKWLGKYIRLDGAKCFLEKAKLEK